MTFTNKHLRDFAAFFEMTSGCVLLMKNSEVRKCRKTISLIAVYSLRKVQ
jgi:hypothetical protein